MCDGQRGGGAGLRGIEDGGAHKLAAVEVVDGQGQWTVDSSAVGDGDDELPAIEGDECLGVGLRNAVDAVDAQDVEQTTVGVNLAVAVEVVGIVEVRVRAAAGAADDAHDVLGGEVGFGLQPECYDARHDGTGHRRSGIGVPGVGASLVVEVCHVPLDVAGRGVVLQIVAAVG